MRVMSAGDGYKYLLKSVAAGDGGRSLSTPLTRYYAEAGTPPGFWMGSGLGRLGHGELVEKAQVSEAQLALLIGTGHDPITGDPLGRAYQQFASIGERIKQRVDALDPELGPSARAQEVAAIEAEEAERGTRRAVAGYDFTFSVPKSVSTIWAVADAGTQSLVAEAHHAAVAELVAFLEREVAATRVGATGPDGAVAHVDVAGVVAAAFDHYDSRSGDPQLHTHVVISNKVLTVQDGCWRTLAGRPMHAVVVAVSELYNAALADQLTRVLGVEWEARERGRDRNPAWEIEGVRRVGDRVLHPLSAHRGRERPSHRRVRRQARPAALGADGAETPGAGHARHEAGEAGPVAGRPHPRVAPARQPSAREGRERLGAHAHRIHRAGAAAGAARR
jgi:hypothetical protein